MTKTTPSVRLRSGLPSKARQPLETARSLYLLEMRRRNLQIKQQIEHKKLERIDRDLAVIEGQIAALGGSLAAELQMADLLAPEMDEESNAEDALPFTLNY